MTDSHKELSEISDFPLTWKPVVWYHASIFTEACFPGFSESFEGEMLDISFNSEFVVSAIKALGSEDVIFSFIGEMKPFVIKNPNDTSVIQIVTPVRTF